MDNVGIGQLFKDRVKLPILIDLAFILSSDQILHVSMFVLLATPKRIPSLFAGVYDFDHLFVCYILSLRIFVLFKINKF